jgi:hypothetical protein
MNGGLGFSLKPPKWLREAAGKIISGIKVEPPPPISIPLPGGRGQVVLSTRPMDQAGQFVEQNVPGGWGTVALIGAGVLALMLMGGRRRRG